MDWRGEVLAGRYELTERLGRGGMGEVWAARDRVLHRDVALKVLSLGGGGHPELLPRFEREAVAGAQINHPNVAALYDQDVHEGMLFLVMEKVNGAPLTEYIQADSPLPLERALDIAKEISEALVYAHQAGVVHYDIKPHNVMLTADGRVKVVDFGIAGFLHTQPLVARSSQLSPAGTPEYGAPEQFSIERGDERSDLYALGGVLFALLSGRPPFSGHSALAIMRRKTDEEAPSLKTLRPDLPAAVTKLVAELLRRDPDKRPQTADEVRTRLAQLREPPPPPPPPPGGTFTISWTGQDPLSSYTDSPGRGRLIRWAAAVLMLAPWGVWLPLEQGKLQPGSGQGDGWILLVAASACVGVAALGWLLSLPVLTYLHRTPKGWSLSIGPQCIETTGRSGKRTYRWNHVKDVTIEEIHGATGAPYQFTGLHLRLKKKHDTAQLLHTEPAGWARFATVTPRQDKLVPVCVLGPMTEEERTQLAQALARYSPVAQ